MQQIGATSFAVIRDRRINDSVAFDATFIGFTELHQRDCSPYGRGPGWNGAEFGAGTGIVIPVVYRAGLDCDDKAISSKSLATNTDRPSDDHLDQYRRRAE